MIKQFGGKPTSDLISRVQSMIEAGISIHSVVEVIRKDD